MNTHHTKQKGDLGVIAVAKDLIQKGFFVSLPLTENAPFDLIASSQKNDYRVQVKSCSAKNGSVSVDLRGSWADQYGVHTGLYDLDDFEVLAVYVLERDICLYFSFAGEKSVCIRLDEPKNNQKLGVKMWSEYLSFPPSETIRDAPKAE